MASAFGVHGQVKTRPSIWGYFLWLDYPASDSLRKLKAAKGAGRIPVNAEAGSQIRIHGVPSGKDELIDRRVNWTFGCISLKSAGIEDLYHAVGRGTPVQIVSGRTGSGGTQIREKTGASHASK